MIIKRAAASLLAVAMLCSTSHGAALDPSSAERSIWCNDYAYDVLSLAQLKMSGQPDHKAISFFLEVDANYPAALAIVSLGRDGINKLMANIYGYDSPAYMRDNYFFLRVRKDCENGDLDYYDRIPTF